LGPWENGEWRGPSSGLYKSVDGGTTWRKIINGLPTFKQGLGRIGVCVAPSDDKRMYATIEANDGAMGLYRSDDAGENWKQLNSDERYSGRGDDFGELEVDTKNP